MICRMSANDVRDTVPHLATAHGYLEYHGQYRTEKQDVSFFFGDVTPTILVDGHLEYRK